MYTIRLDDTLMFDPRVDELEIFDARAQFEVNKTNGLDFTVYPSHPLYARFKRFKSIVELYQNNVLLFRGRVLNDEAGLYNEKKIICEGELAYFNDTIIRPFEFQGTIEGFLSYIISQHNSQVENIKKFTLGNVTVTNSTNNIVRSSIDAQTSWEIINNRLIKLLGGYIVLRRANNINYIDYLADSNYMSLQKIELGKNLLDLTRRINGDEVITALIPYGAKIDEQSDERITIKSVNNNIDYIYDQEAVEKHGWIFGTETWDDVTIPSNLLTKARQTLAAGILLNSSIELTALDLSLMDISIDEFRIFEYVKVEVPTHLIDDNLLISKMSLDILSPENNKLTLGLDIQTFTERQIQNEKALGNITTIKGPKGDKGESVDDITVEFYLSTSKTELVGGEWKTELDKWIAGHYMWTRNKIVYKNPARTEYTTPVLDSSWEAIEDLEQDIKNELDDKASNDYVTSVETTLNTTIEESAGEFRREMSESYTSKSEFGTYKETVSSQFDQTAKGFGLTFKNLIEQIETLDGETKATFDEIVKYIRFVDGNIILGKVGNELELKIRHDRIQFIQSGVEVAYFSNNKLYVTDGEFINSLKLGNFTFIPRENGSLDFRKVVN